MPCLPLRGRRAHDWSWQDELKNLRAKAAAANESSADASAALAESNTKLAAAQQELASFAAQPGPAPDRDQQIAALQSEVEQWKTEAQSARQQAKEDSEKAAKLRTQLASDQEKATQLAEGKSTDAYYQTMHD